jgi:KRAB domain-containing zinc finger protein
MDDFEDSLPSYTLGSTSSTEPSFPCKLCGKVLTSSKSLTRHTSIHDRPILQCQTCSRVFKNTFLLAKHICKTCGFCLRVFPSKEALKKHKEVEHENEKRVHKKKKPPQVFQCEICEKSFASNYRLTEHMNQHENLRMHKCPFCDYTCNRVKYLNRHIPTHDKTRKRKLSCPECEFTTDRSDTLKQHILRHSDVFKCLDCDFETKDKEEHEKHIDDFSHRFQILNDKKEAIKCEKCFAVKNGMRAFKQHMARAHKER